MKFSSATSGRVFVIRLEDGEIVHEQIENFAVERSIKSAGLIIVGGAAKGGNIVVGPENADERPIKPMQLVLDEVYETTGTGTLFPDENGKPVLHMHVSCGRKSKTVTGCIRNGLRVWQVMEVILFEIVDSEAKRVTEPKLGFKLLEP